MYNAVIDNGTTYLFLDNGNDDVYSGQMSGFLINNSNIINLMRSLPIKQFYLRTKEDIRTKISEEQAYYLYQQLTNYHNKKDNDRLKKAL